MVCAAITWRNKDLYIRGCQFALKVTFRIAVSKAIIILIFKSNPLTIERIDLYLVFKSWPVGRQGLSQIGLDKVDNNHSHGVSTCLVLTLLSQLELGRCRFCFDFLKSRCRCRFRFFALSRCRCRFRLFDEHCSSRQIRPSDRL